MVANIDVIIERGEKLELLVDKTEHLATNSVTFRFELFLEKETLTYRFTQEHLKKPSACHLVEKHETDHWPGDWGYSLPLRCGVTSLWGACLVQMCGLMNIVDMAKSLLLEGVKSSGHTSRNLRVRLNHTFFTITQTKISFII